MTTPMTEAEDHHRDKTDGSPLIGIAWGLGFLWMAGISLRVTVLAVPPVLPAIHQDLHLDETAVGALTALPVLLLAAAAVPGSLLIARVGARRALIASLMLVAVAGAVRGVGSSALILYPLTFLMGVGIAVSQPALPSLVRQWFPGRIAVATATYSNGLLVGEIVAAALTVPLLPVVGGSWPLILAIWSIPVLLTALAVWLRTPHVATQPDAAPVRWWPDWGSGLTWRLGLILGTASTAYFVSNAFIPDYLKVTHHSGLIAAALTSVNLSQLPASLIVAAIPGRVVGARWPLLGVGILTMVGTACIALGADWVVVGAAFVGFSSAMILVLNLSLPPLLAGPGDVHRLSAAMFTISYTCSFLGSLVAGVIWDVTGVPFSAFWLVTLAGIALIVLASGTHVGANTVRARD